MDEGGDGGDLQGEGLAQSLGPGAVPQTHDGSESRKRSAYPVRTLEPSEGARHAARKSAVSNDFSAEKRVAATHASSSLLALGTPSRTIAPPLLAESTVVSLYASCHRSRRASRSR